MSDHPESLTLCGLGRVQAHLRAMVAAVLCALLLPILTTPALAAPAITDLTYELAGLSEPELQEDWNAADGGATRSGIQINSVNNTRYYWRSDIGLDNGEAFLMDAVVSGSPLAADGELGPRMWAKFRFQGMPPATYFFVEVRFLRSAGTYRVGLGDGTGGLKGSLPKDWTSLTPRLRVRIRHQEMEGVRTIFLIAEDSSLWKADLSEPLSPDSTNTLSVPLSAFGIGTGPSQFGFGNVASASYYSEWELVRVIRSSESDTFLPPPQSFVPALPPAGALVLVMALVGASALLLRARRPTRACSRQRPADLN